MGSTLTVDNIVGATTAGNVKLPAGAVLQTKQFSLTTAESISSTSFVDSSVTVNITPKYSTSKIRATITGYFGQNFWYASPHWRLRRGSTTISANDTNFWPRVQYDSTRDSESCLSIVMDILDSPATTSATTYNVLLSHNSGSSQNFHVNRSDQDGNSGDRPRTMSTLTLMEIAQ